MKNFNILGFHGKIWVLGGVFEFSAQYLARSKETKVVFWSPTSYRIWFSISIKTVLIDCSNPCFIISNLIDDCIKIWFNFIWIEVLTVLFKVTLFKKWLLAKWVSNNVFNTGFIKNAKIEIRQFTYAILTCSIDFHWCE